MAKKPATASYWAHSFYPWGGPREWMWNCETCEALGITESEADAVRDMNAHMKEAHADRSYEAPPVPE